MSNKEKKAKITPIGGRVLVKPIERKTEKEQMKDGIYIPDSAAQERSKEAEIVALPECEDKDNKCEDKDKKARFEMKVGNTVLISKYGGTEVDVDGVPYMLVPKEEILAVIS